MWRQRGIFSNKASTAPSSASTPMGPIGDGNEAPPPPPPIPRIHETLNIPHFQPQTQLSSGLQLQGNSTSAFTEPTYEIQFEQVLGPTSGFTNYPHPRGGSPMQTESPNTLQRGVSGFHHSSNEVGESSSRNVKRRMTIQEPQVGSSLYPTGQVNGNSSQLWAMRNTIYDPSYAMRGLPVDPHLRVLLILRNRNQP
ncbi:hypothetical protein CR513_58705, partial [Mucuna pruriens]